MLHTPQNKMFAHHSSPVVVLPELYTGRWLVYSLVKWIGSNQASKRQENENL